MTLCVWVTTEKKIKLTTAIHGARRDMLEDAGATSEAIWAGIHC